jgi:hypothetical protein
MLMVFKERKKLKTLGSAEISLLAQLRRKANIMVVLSTIGEQSR